LSFWHSMTWHTEGIRVVEPVKWRCLDGIVGAYWQARSEAGAKGYYMADDPRIMIFFCDVSEHIRMSNDDATFVRSARPMTRAVYVPARVPLWTNSRATHNFSHLNLHIHKDRMLRYLAPSLGRSAALAALRQPVEIQDADTIETLAGLLVDEVGNPTRHGIYAESLVGSIVTGMLDIPQETSADGNIRLTQAQMNKLVSRVEEQSHHRLSVAEMAATVGLSESWFFNAFKHTTGTTPVQWQLGKRIDVAKQLLLDGGLSVASVAAQLGFSDQAHLTKVFRQTVGHTPAAWRKLHQPAQSTVAGQTVRAKPG